MRATASWSRHGHTLILACVILLATFLRLYNLGAGSLWLDESFTLEDASVPFLRIVDPSEGLNSEHMPLYFWIMHLVLLVGDSETWIRIPSALFGILTVPVLYGVVKDLFDSDSALGASVLLATSPFHIHYSQEARMYPLLTFLSLLSLLAMLRMLNGKGNRYWLLFVGSTIMNLYTHYFALLATGSILLAGALPLLYDATVARRRDALVPLRKLVSAVLVIALLYAPWVPRIQGRLLPGNDDRLVASGRSAFVVDAQLLDQIQSDFGGGTTRSSQAILWVATLGFIMALLLRKCRAVGLFALLAGTLLFAIPVLRPYRFDPRYASYAQPLYLSFAAFAVTSLGWSISARMPSCHRLVYGSFLLLGIASLAVVSVNAIGNNSRWLKADWRSVAYYLQSNLQKGGIVIADGTSYGSVFGGDSGVCLRMLSWYVDRLDLQLELLREVDVSRGITRIGEHSREVCLVLLAPQVQLRAPENVSVIQFEDVAVVRLKNPPPTSRECAMQMLSAGIQMIRQKEARFDLHLALAEIYRSAGDVIKSQEQIALALDCKPKTFDPAGPRGAAYRRLGL